MSLVCRSWRQAAMPFLVMTCFMDSKLDTLDIPPASLIPWFKTVSLSVNFPIYDKVIKHGQGLVYTNANSLCVTIYHDVVEFNPTQKEIQKLTANGSKFVDYIRQMVPNVTNVQVNVADCTENSIYPGSTYKNMVVGLAGSLVQLANTQIKVFSPQVLGGLEWDSISNGHNVQQLSNISLHVGGANGNGLEIVGKNSATLQTLSTSFTDKDDEFSEFITDKDGNSIIYSELKRLELSFWHSDDEVVRFPSNIFAKNVVPFPNLQQLVIQGNYLLRDDVVFRGNCNSLKYLSLEITPHVIEILNSHRIFSTGKYKKLERVRLEVGTAEREIDFGITCARTAADIGCYARVLRFIDNFMDKEIETELDKQLVTRFCQSPGLQNIEILDLSAIRVDLEDILNMAMELPSLMKLYVFDTINPNLPEGMSVSQMVDRFRSINTRLKLLAITMVDEIDEAEVARGLAVLAILCPDLMEIRILTKCLEDAWTDALLEEEFEEYRERLGQIKLIRVIIQ